MTVLSPEQSLPNGKCAEIDFGLQQHSTALPFRFAIRNVVKILCGISVLFARGTAVLGIPITAMEHPNRFLLKKTVVLQLRGHALSH